jgi:nitrate/nitrite transporter NarK
MIPLLTEQENTLSRPRGSIIQTSHQSWKLFGGFIVLFGGFVAMAYGLAHLQDRDGFAITLAGIAVSLGGPISAAQRVARDGCGWR